MKVNATDKDVSNEFNQITYTLRTNYEFFKIDNKTGDVTALTTFDYEKKSYYYLIIEASDNSPTPSFKNGLSKNVSYEINIVDENDNPPKFENSSYNFKLLDNATIGSCPFAIKAFDKDVTSKVKYTIISRTDDELFKIDETTGAICLNKNLTYDIDLNTFNLAADAFDGKFHDNTTISITIEDVTTDLSEKKNAIELKRQKFKKPVYEFYVFENTTAGNCIVKINTKYSKYWYTVNDTSTFAILNNNSIIFHQKFDYEKKTVYYLNLTANVQEKKNDTRIKQMTTKLIINVIDVNDEWPNHSQQEDIVIQENNAIGAHVMKVDAIDKDISKEFNQITYTLRNNREIFKINEKTGNVTALKSFDYEEKKYYVLEIVASDNSPTGSFTNGLAITTSYIINIVDENDNPPKFEISSYNFKFLENTTVGSCPFAIMASDKDENSKIKYTVISRTDDELFKVDETTGAIYINNNIPILEIIEDVKIFKNQSVGSVVMKVHATDADKSNKIKYRFGNNETKFSINETTGEIRTLVKLDKETQTNFSLLVIASDDSPSAITNNGEPNEVKKYYNIVIDDENYNSPKFENSLNQYAVLEGTAVGNCSITIQATDKDKNSQIKYTIISRTDDDLFRINESTGAICLNKNLTDDNILKTFNLTVDGSDGKFNDNTRISITIEDINNNIPILEIMEDVKIFKNQSVGSVVMKVHATDADKSNKIKYRFGNNETKFSINETTGEIRTLVKLDKETQTNFSLLVIASDDSPSAITDNGEPNEVKQYYNIVIDDENYNSPTFESSSYNFKFLENTTVGSCAFAIKASDKDKDSKINYTIISRTDDNLFRINESTGDICLTKNLTDDNILNVFNLTVDAFDGKFHDNTTISITIEDINNNIPILEIVDDVKIFKNQSVGSVVMKVHATDADKSNKIKYRFGNNETKFSINETTGEIRTLVQLDKETQTNFSLLVIASDNSSSAITNNGEPNEVKQYYNIVIDDENYNAPKFENSLNKFVILENATIGSCPFTVEAFDKDKNRQIKYTIISRADDDLFRINESTDINNNIPVFKDVDEVKIFKNQSVGSVVMKVHATDADKSNKIKYRFGNNETKFSINETTGEIKTLVQLDKETQTNFSLLVIASDDSPSAITVDGKANEVKQYYNILIDDGNYNSPKFENSSYNFKFLENTTVKSCPFAIKAFDQDETSQVKYTVISRTDDELFKIDETTGDICLNKNITDDNILKTFILTVDAFDGKFHDNTTISITIEDINNNVPVFKDVDDVKIFKNQSVGSVVMTVHATDADKSPQNNEIEYTLGNNEANFSIDKKTGEVKILPSFDREQQTNFSLLVIAYDNSPSAITNDGKPNEVKQYYNIFIDDEDDTAKNPKSSFVNPDMSENKNEKQRDYNAFTKNHDNALTFEKPVYHVTIYKNENIGYSLLTVKANHKYSSSKITYSIISGNEYKTFKIDDSTGLISIDQALDRISVDSYNLIIKASDGIYDDKTTVSIVIKTPIITYIIIIIIIILLTLLLAVILYALYQKFGQASGKYNILSRMKRTTGRKPLV
ncbi:protocadherin Fat 4-like [Aphidius gifuensis]|uniref:protocadherin Fat 4-like n=1 Tax=Aphidius gifuensis TaxID=684658 RepID=UPI001CDD8122|nr:protocadherin Fat 4-like [Aphidius gifuensis]